MTNEGHVSRREFIRRAAQGAAGVAAGAAAVRTAAAGATAPYKRILPASVLGANERILTGHIGVGGMGTRNLGFVLARDDMQPVAICDVWPPHRYRAVEMVKGKFADMPPSVHQDYREVIENKDIDAVVVCTPDHWHAMPSIAACEAGKDVYCEKPLATTILEGRAMVDAARANGTVFQAGTMQRSGEHFQEAVKLVQDGYIGTVTKAETWIHDSNPLDEIGDPPNEAPPAGLDWKWYQGWTEHVPYNRNRFLYNFRWFLDYSGGKVTDWGAHLVDIVVWAMGEDKPVRSVASFGDKFVMTDNRTTPDTLEVSWEFDDYIMNFSNRVVNGTRPYKGWRHGIVFFGTKGTMLLSRQGFDIIPINDGCEPMERGGSPMNEPHWQNFVDCIRSRNRPICDVEVCHITTSVCHMATAAYVSGGRPRWDAGRERFVPDTDDARRADDFAFRPYRNGFDLRNPMA
jgi:predicted dehydrogenase